jgi:hypothetical protein
MYIPGSSVVRKGFGSYRFAKRVSFEAAKQRFAEPKLKTNMKNINKDLFFIN